MLAQTHTGYGSESRLNEQRLDALVAFALVAVAIFPVFGNAIGLLMHIPRRIAQLGTLSLFGAWAAYGWHLHYGQTNVFRLFSARRLTIAFLSSTVIVGVVAGRALGMGGRPSLYAIYAVIAAVLWLTLVGYVLLDRSPAQRSSEISGASESFSALVLVLVATLAGIAYFLGPEPGDAYMAFRGSTTYAGTGAAILCAVALGFLNGWVRVAALVGAMYLSFLATSRTGLLLLVVMCAVMLRACPREKPISRGPKLVQEVALLVICAILVVLPANAFSYHYPYASSRPGPAGAKVLNGETRLTEWQALGLRYQRVLRLALKPDPNLPTSEILRLEGEGKAESRWSILLTSLRAIASNPWGYWPRSFDQVVRMDCGQRRACAYPHNLVLEIGYHFGWIPLLLLAAGLSVWGFRVITSLPGTPLLARVAAVAFLGNLGFALVSGNLVDNTLAMMFGLIWLVTQAMSRFGAQPDGA